MANISTLSRLFRRKKKRKENLSLKSTVLPDVKYRKEDLLDDTDASVS